MNKIGLKILIALTGFDTMIYINLQSIYNYAIFI